MKQFLILSLIFPVFLIKSSVTLSAQGETDKPPCFVGGDFTDYSTWNLVYPNSLLRANTPGEATCYLSVDSTGYVRSKRIVTSHPLFEEEAKRLIRYACYWEPAQKNGKPVASSAVVSISFKPDAYRHRLKWQEQKLEACKGQEVDSEPVFPDEIRRIVMGNMRWPDSAEMDTATVVCRFTVPPTGFVKNVWIEKGAGREFNNEALSLIYSFPYLIPALKDGKAVSFDYRLTIRFWRNDYDWYRKPVNKEQNHIFGGHSEEMPEFPGGHTELLNFLKNQIQITPEMKEKGKKGRVTCSFAVYPDGTIRKLEVIRGLHPLQDAEALRVLRSMPRWKGARVCGYTKRPYCIFTRVKYTVPVKFDW